MIKSAQETKKDVQFVKYQQRIKDVREDRDLKQAEVAKVLNMKQQQYSNYERGYRNLPIEHLITLCEYYNLSADYLLGLTDEPRPLK